jgi:hypothetical protein
MHRLADAAHADRQLCAVPVGLDASTEEPPNPRPETLNIARPAQVCRLGPLLNDLHC